MTAKERPTPSRNAPHGKPRRKQVYDEESIKTERLLIEHKAFILSLRSNPRGRFLRITEDVHGRRDSIIVPAPGLEQFRKAVEAIAKLSSEQPETEAQPAEAVGETKE